MNLKRLSLEEYHKRIPKSYLEECLENGIAEYYIVNYNGEEHQFFFYKNGDVADICIEEKSFNSFFEYEDAMNDIFLFLREKGFKVVKITLLNDNFIERHNLALKYGFKKIKTDEYAGKLFTHYDKKI